MSYLLNQAQIVVCIENKGGVLLLAGPVVFNCIVCVWLQKFWFKCSHFEFILKNTQISCLQLRNRLQWWHVSSFIARISYFNVIVIVSTGIDTLSFFKNSM